MRGVPAHEGPLAAEVPGRRIPVLDVHQPEPGALALEDLEGPDVEPGRLAPRAGGRLADERRLGILLEHDQRMAEIDTTLVGQAHQAEQWRLDLNAPGHVKQRTAGPERGVQGGEDVVRRGHRLGHQVAADQLGMVLDGLVQVEEDRAAQPAGSACRTAVPLTCSIPVA